MISDAVKGKKGIEIDLEFLKHQSLLKGFTDDQLHYLGERFVKEKYLPNQIIISEGDKSHDLYLLLEGEASVLKWADDHHAQLPIGKLIKGEMFGEMSLMDGSPRSSTIKAINELTVLKLSKELLTSSSIEMQRKMFANIAHENINRLREANKLAVQKLRTQLNGYQIRINIGQFLIFQLLLMCVCTFAGYFFSQEIRTYFLWISTCVTTFLLIKSQDYEWNKFGLIPFQENKFIN